jgi:hypothetical protein
VVQVLEDAERLIAAWNERQAKPRVVSGVARAYNLRSQGAPQMGPAACCAGEDRDHAVGQPIRRLKEPDEFSVTVTRGNCAREIGMSAGKMKAGGVGATFDAAWDNVTGLPF